MFIIIYIATTKDKKTCKNRYYGKKYVTNQKVHQVAAFTSSISDKFGDSFIKNYVIFIYLLCIYKRPIILSLFKIDALNFTMYILTILTYPLKTYVLDYII